MKNESAGAEPFTVNCPDALVVDDPYGDCSVCDGPNVTSTWRPDMHFALVVVIAPEMLVTVDPVTWALIEPATTWVWDFLSRASVGPATTANSAAKIAKNARRRIIVPSAR